MANYGQVRYAGLYEGIDAVFYGTGQQLEYDFEVAPGADPSEVWVRFEGQESMEVSEEGDLVLHLRGGEIREQRAEVYQEGEKGNKQKVEAQYVLGPDGQVGFAVDAFDRTKTLTIDPAIVYSDYLGGGLFTLASGLAVDAAGAAYVTGGTESPAFPVTGAAFDASYNGGTDVFVTKLSSDGSSAVYSTFLGGPGEDEGLSIAVDGSGRAYVVGLASSGYPVSHLAVDQTCIGVDGFVTKLNPSGSSLIYSTFLGGSGDDVCEGVAVDGSGAAYVTGFTSSSDFPWTGNAFDRTYNGVCDAFVTKLSGEGTTYVYSTYLGGSDEDDGWDIKVDGSGSAYVVGSTRSANFPTTASAFDSSYDGGTSDGFVARVRSDGAALAYSSFLGGAGDDAAYGIAVDAGHSVYVTGRTYSADFPTTGGAFDMTLHGTSDGFVTKLNLTNGAPPIYSTLLGGATDDGSFGIAVDAGGNAYVSGWTESADFPVTQGVYDSSLEGTRDAFVTKLNPNGATLSYSTLLGGGDWDVGGLIGLDGSGAAYVAGTTRSADFPVTSGVYDTAFNLFYDNFVTKLNADASSLVYSSYLGGADFNIAAGIAIDATGSAYVTGTTAAITFPTTPGAYDTTYNLGMIDAFVAELNPSGTSLIFSTYLGGSGTDYGRSVAINQGSLIIAGDTWSANFPTTPGAYDTTHNGLDDGFLAKLTGNGTALVYSTFFGGSGDDEPVALAVDSSGSAYVTGLTRSSNFPVSIGAYDTTFNGDVDAFVTKFSQSGSLLYSTFLGGAGLDQGRDIAVDNSGVAYVAGTTYSANFPATVFAYDQTFNGGSDAFVAKLSASGGSLLYSTFIGGAGEDAGLGIAVDATHAVYVTGRTASSDFPTTAGAYDRTYGGEDDSFVTKLNANAFAPLTYSTLLGGVHFDAALAVAVDGSGTAYVTGFTGSSDFPVTANAFDTTYNGGGYDAFVTRVSGNGSALVSSTFLGGSGNDLGFDIAVDASGRTYVAGQTSSPSFLGHGFGSTGGLSAMVVAFN